MKPKKAGLTIAGLSLKLLDYKVGNLFFTFFCSLFIIIFIFAPNFLKNNNLMINITLPDNSVKQFEKGVTALEIAKSISEDLARNVLGAKVNNEILEATHPINSDAKLKLLTWNDDEGKAIMWHSSAHLMAEAIEALYPGVKFGIGPNIENGFYYDIDFGDRTISENDFKKIEDKMLQLAREKQKFSRKEVSKDDAIKYFTEKGDDYKLELINELEDDEITFYESGNFIDLCRGPHLPDTSPIKAVKLLNIAGAYWRGDEKRKQLTRIYGISFPKQKELIQYLHLLEEAKKRDHRKIGKELELFTFSPRVGLGLPLWLPKGNELKDRLEDFLKKVLKKRGHELVSSMHIGNVNLYKLSGHYDKYGEDSFQPVSTPVKDEQFMLKPMNCPHHCEIYNFKPHSYKDLPIRMAEFGTVYRYEQSGELHGLTRVRGFTQDDAHIFCRPDQVKEEFIAIIDLVQYVYRILGFKEFEIQISLRGDQSKEKYIGSDENWEKAEKAILEVAEEKGLQSKIEYGEAAFYGPKLDFMIKDALGRKWQLGTIQVDYNLPERFDLTYTGSDNLKHRPVMIHRAILGSTERVIALLIENTVGKFPLWLTPEQLIILPISEKYHNYAKKVLNLLNNYELRSLIDERSEKTGRKIRDAELQKIPYMLIVGEKEENENTVSVRKQGIGDLGTYKIEDFVKLVNDEINKLIA